MIAFDTNILIYASEQNEPQGRDITALEWMSRVAPLQAILPLRVIGEFINACRRKKIASLPDASVRAALWMELYKTPSSMPGDYIEAASFSTAFGLQYFDALIVAVAQRAGAILLLSEDMHDGLQVGNLKIVNPFTAVNETLLADYFGSTL